jgi:cystathionine beta-synthase
VKETDTCETAFAIMQKYGISQIPVTNEQKSFSGALEDAGLYAALLKNRDLMQSQVKDVMRKPFPIVSYSDTIDHVSALINKDNNAVLMMDLGGNWHIITRYDVIGAMSE